VRPLWRGWQAVRSAVRARVLQRVFGDDAVRRAAHRWRGAVPTLRGARVDDGSWGSGGRYAFCHAPVLLSCVTRMVARWVVAGSGAAGAEGGVRSDVGGRAASTPHSRPGRLWLPRTTHRGEAAAAAHTARKQPGLVGALRSKGPQFQCSRAERLAQAARARSATEIDAAHGRVVASDARVRKKQGVHLKHTADYLSYHLIHIRGTTRPWFD
jgi:hypothetical protein